MAIELNRVGEFHGSGGSALAVDPNGEVAVAAGTGTATVWSEGEVSHTVALPGYVAGPIAIAPLGRAALVGQWKLDLATGDTSPVHAGIELLISGIDFARRAAPRFYNVESTAVSADGSRMVASFVFGPSRGIGDDEPNPGPEGQVVLVNPTSGEFVAVLEDIEFMSGRRALAIDGDHVIGAGERVRVWNVSDGTPVSEGEPGAMRSDVRLSPQGDTFAATRFDGTIEYGPVTDVASAVAWSGHSDRAITLAFDPTRPVLATGGEDQQVKLWALGEGEPALAGWFWAEQNVTSLAFEPSGQHLLVGTMSEVIVVEISGVLD